MDKTVKRIMLLFLVLVLIYIQQATVIYARNAGENGSIEAGEEDEEKPDGKEESTGEEGDGGSEPEEPEKPKPEIKSFVTEISKADGKEGIYVTKPGIQIRHVSECGITKYQLVKGEKILAKGILEQEGQEVLIAGEAFEEGTQQLKVWMEDEEGQAVKGFVLQETDRKSVV